MAARGWLFERSAYAVDTHYGNHAAGVAPKVVLHTPEIPDRTPAQGGLESVVKQVQAGKSKPVYQVYCSPKNRQVLQAARLDRAGGSLRRPGSTETNRAGVLSVSIAGYAGDMKHLTDSDLVWLGETVVGPIAEEYGVDLSSVWTPNNASNGYGYGAPQRIKDRSVWYPANGVMCHQHAMDQTHWDCGQINTPRIAAAASGPAYDHGGWVDGEDQDVAIICKHGEPPKGYSVSVGEPIVAFGGAREPDFGAVNPRPGGNAVVRAFDDDGVTLMDSTGRPMGSYYNLRSWSGAA